MSPRLTLNMGVRYEYFTPVIERDGFLFNVVRQPVWRVSQTGRADLGTRSK